MNANNDPLSVRSADPFPGQMRREDLLASASTLNRLSPSSRIGRGRCVACRAVASESLERQADLEDLDRVEVEFGIQAALDSSGLAKAVLLAGKQQITNWFAFVA